MASLNQTQAVPRLAARSVAVPTQIPKRQVFGWKSSRDRQFDPAMVLLLLNQAVTEQDNSLVVSELYLVAVERALKAAERQGQKQYRE